LSATPALAASIAVFAHNEAAGIAACLDSVYRAASPRPFRIHVLANGCTDGTESLVEAYARARPEVTLHSIPLGDKSNAWNVYVHDVAAAAPVHCFVDGDVRVEPGSIGALARTLAAAPGSNAAAALPAAGRNVAAFAREVSESHALAGNLYALSGDFVRRVRAAGLRLPVGLIGDDSWVGALALMDLDPSSGWRKERVSVCSDARFAFDSLRWHRVADARLYWRRRIRYGLRRWQTVMLRAHIAEHGLADLPGDVRELYRDYAHLCRLTWSGVDTLFLWLARARIHVALRGA
jgi:glycosyltransferase involved in cell wall biosynthesis